MNANHLQYVTGDATAPVGQGRKLLAHVSTMRADGTKASSRRSLPGGANRKRRARRWFHTPSRPPGASALGAVHFVEVAPDLIVANMIAQHSFYTDEQGLPPIRYEALRQALRKVRLQAQMQNASVHAPRLGAGLAGGDW